MNKRTKALEKAKGGMSKKQREILGRETRERHGVELKKGFNFPTIKK